MKVAGLVILLAGFVWLGAFAMHDGFRTWMKRQTWASLRAALARIGGAA